jgi:hypothetical protein
MKTLMEGQKRMKVVLSVNWGKKFVRAKKGMTKFLRAK